MDLKIEKGIPIPRGNTKKASAPKNYPEMDEMKVGDSIFFPGVWVPRTGEERQASGWNRLQSAMARCRRRYDWKLATRKLEENGEIGTRVWRTE